MGFTIFLDSTLTSSDSSLPPHPTGDSPPPRCPSQILINPFLTLWASERREVSSSCVEFTGVCCKNWKASQWLKNGEWEEIRGGLGCGGGRKLGPKLWVWEVRAQGAAWNSKMGGKFSAAFIWKLAWKSTLSLGGTEAKTKFSEPNTPFNQPLKPRRREGRKGRAKGQRGLPFIWTWLWRWQ